MVALEFLLANEPFTIKEHKVPSFNFSVITEVCESLRGTPFCRKQEADFVLFPDKPVAPDLPSSVSLTVHLSQQTLQDAFNLWRLQYVLNKVILI